MPSVLWFWIFGYFIISIYAHNKYHKCIHDELKHQISRQYVRYKSEGSNKRNLLHSNRYKPIRIRPYYDPKTINANTLSMERMNYIKSLISATILYLQQFVYVIPIDGPLLINRCQRIWTYADFKYSVCPLSDYAEPLKCQYVEIPNAHIAESWYYDPLTFKSTKYQKGGNGIADTDLIIYVSHSNGQCNSDGSTLAWASICSLDQFGRPISGTLNFCANALDAKYWKFDVGITLHEIMHILVMSSSLLPYFYDFGAASFQSAENVVAKWQNNEWITTQRVQSAARKHYGCDNLIGAALENFGSAGTVGSHWESKYAEGEIMCGTKYSAVTKLSELTLALMEDSGWYNVDYRFAERLNWAKNEGCDFFNKECVNKQSGKSNFEQFWCANNRDDGCSHDYSSVAQCKNEATRRSFHGPQTHDYCAFREPKRQMIDSQNADYEQICWDLRGNIYSKSSNYPSSSFGVNSRCVEIDDGTNKNGHCFKHECVEYDVMNQRYNAVNILINDGSVNTAEIIRCDRSESLQWKSSNAYSANIKCPNVDTLCGKSLKPFECFWGEYNDELAKCICSVGFVGNDCSIPDIYRFAAEASIAVSLSVPKVQNGAICIDSVKSVINGNYAFDGEYEGLASYQHQSQNLFIYFIRYYSQWNIGSFKGSQSLFAYCTESLPLNQNIDIRDCANWIIWDDAAGFVYDFELQLYECKQPSTNPTITPSVTPSITPSMNPSNKPSEYPTYNDDTNDPTEDPTDFPTAIPSDVPTTHPTTRNPTAHPIKTTTPTVMPSTNPSRRPTAQPTSFPTSIPSLYPSYLPSLSPSYDPTTLPTDFPSNKPSKAPSTSPTITPSVIPSGSPSRAPSNIPSIIPSNTPSSSPFMNPTFSPTSTPNISPSKQPTDHPKPIPSLAPISFPSTHPTILPTQSPSKAPTGKPTILPTNLPSLSPTNLPTNSPSHNPSKQPTSSPSLSPSKRPTRSPTQRPTENPSMFPTDSPSLYPTDHPTDSMTNIMASTKILIADNLFMIDKDEKEKEKETFIVGTVALVGICMFLNIPFIVLCIWNCCIKQNELHCCIHWYVEKRQRLSTFQRIATPSSGKIDTSHTDIDEDAFEDTGI